MTGLEQRLAEQRRVRETKALAAERDQFVAVYGSVLWKQQQERARRARNEAVRTANIALKAARRAGHQLAFTDDGEATA